MIYIVVSDDFYLKISLINKLSLILRFIFLGDIYISYNYNAYIPIIILARVFVKNKQLKNIII